MTVGELFSGDPALAPKLSAPRHLVFDLELIRQRWNARGFADASPGTRSGSVPDGWPTIVLSNHDQPRQASRLAPRCRSRRPATRSRAPRAVLSLTLRGTPFLYYGEEIGARDVPVPWPEIIDPPAKRGGRLVRRLVAVVEPRSGAIADALGRRAERRLLDRPAVAADGARRRRPGTWPPRSADPASVLATVPAAALAATTHPALQVGALSRARVRRPRDVVRVRARDARRDDRGRDQFRRRSRPAFRAPDRAAAGP